VLYLKPSDLIGIRLFKNKQKILNIKYRYNIVEPVRGEGE